MLFRSSDASTPLALTVTQWARNIGTLAKIKDGYSVNVSQVAANKAYALAQDSRVSQLSVKDTAAAISAQLDSLSQLGSRLTSIDQSDAGQSISVTGRQYAQQSSTLDKLGQNALLSVRKAMASQATALAADTRVKQIAIEDSSLNLGGSIDALQAAVHATIGSSKWSIKSTTDLNPIAISGSQYLLDTDALGVLRGRVKLAVSDLSAISNNLSQVTSDARVSSVSVKRSEEHTSELQSH